MRLVLLLLICSIQLFAYEKPLSTYMASGGVVDILVDENRLYCATSTGSVDVFDLESTKRLQQIKVDKIKDFMGDEVSAKVYSIDRLDGRLLILSQAEKGFRRVHVYENMKLVELISERDELYIAKAEYLDKNTLILGLLSNELVSFDIKRHSVNWQVQASLSKFSDFVLNESKDEIVLADESGDLKVYDSRRGVLLKTLSGQNLDNVFQVDYKNNRIITAGQDRRVVVYRMPEGDAYYIASSFLVYSAGLSPSGALGAYASDEDNHVRVFDTLSRRSIADLEGSKMLITQIHFLNEKEILVASDSREINLFQVK